MKNAKYTQEVKLGFGVVKFKIWNQHLENRGLVRMATKHNISN